MSSTVIGDLGRRADTIDEVLERMSVIEASLAPADGVATFNRMYTHVTRLVRDAVAGEQFLAGEFLERLDVHFANLFFEAHDADVAGAPVSAAWAPLFEARGKPDTHPIQFALAGMNAHISHDLPFALVTTCQEFGIAPEDQTPEHQDFTRTNAVLESASDEIKGWFSSGVVARLDEMGGRLDDGMAMFGIHVARAAAWEASQMLWQLTDNPGMDQLFRSSLSRCVAMANRGILL